MVFVCILYGIMNLSSSRHPYAIYLDGVLAWIITFKELRQANKMLLTKKKGVRNGLLTEDESRS